MKIYDIASADKFELSSISGDLDYGHRIDKVLDEITDELVEKIKQEKIRTFHLQNQSYKRGLIYQISHLFLRHLMFIMS